MTRHPYESPLDQQLRDAKARLLNASRDLSPIKFVQKHPFVSVGAAAATSMVVTAFATSNAAGKMAGVIGNPGAKSLIDLVSKAATIYLTSKAGAAAANAPQPAYQQTGDGHAVD